MTKYNLYPTKHILNIHKHIDGGWFWNKYSASPYMGCEWGCEYCYCRDEKYNPHNHQSKDFEIEKFKDPFSQYIKVKKEAPQLFRKSLEKKPIDLIYLSGYQPIERKYSYIKEMLEVCLELGFPIFINEKSPQLLENLNILRKINQKTHLNIGWSVIFPEDNDKKKFFEPKSPSIDRRFDAMQKLANNNIMTGTVLMPVLPFITDDEPTIHDIIQKTKQSGGKYILEGGLTLWGYTKAHFYKALKKYRPELTKDYEKLYTKKGALEKHMIDLHQMVQKYCKKYDLLNLIPRPINFFPDKLRINKKIAGCFHLKAREIHLSGSSKYREWAFRKAAWSLEELNISVAERYAQEGLKGLMKIKNIGEKMGNEIINELKGIDV